MTLPSVQMSYWLTFDSFLRRGWNLDFECRRRDMLFVAGLGFRSCWVANWLLFCTQDRGPFSRLSNFPGGLLPGPRRIRHESIHVPRQYGLRSEVSTRTPPARMLDWACYWKQHPAEGCRFPLESGDNQQLHPGLLS